MIQPLLRIDDLTVQLRTPHGEAPVLDAVSLDIGAEETVAVVGESGCGKSMLALSIMRLIPERVARISGGSINLGPTDLARLSEGDMQRLKGITFTSARPSSMGVAFVELRGEATVKDGKGTRTLLSEIVVDVSDASNPRLTCAVG